MLPASCSARLHWELLCCFPWELLCGGASVLRRLRSTALVASLLFLSLSIPCCRRVAQLLAPSPDCQCQDLTKTPQALIWVVPVVSLATSQDESD